MNKALLREGQVPAAGRATIAGSGDTAFLAVERLTYHALLAGLQAFLTEGYTGALTIVAAIVSAPVTRRAG